MNILEWITNIFKQAVQLLKTCFFEFLVVPVIFTDYFILSYKVLLYVEVERGGGNTIFLTDPETNRHLCNV